MLKLGKDDTTTLTTTDSSIKASKTKSNVPENVSAAYNDWTQQCSNSLEIAAEHAVYAVFHGPNENF